MASMKRLLTPSWLVIAFLLISFFGLKSLREFRVVNEVTQLKTDHFIIAYKDILPKDAEDVGRKLEDNFNRIREELNDPEHGAIKVFIHGSREEFYGSTGLGNTVTGVSRGPLEFHVLWTNWYNSIFPDDPPTTAVHEFTHCVQLNILITRALKDFTASGAENFDLLFERKFAQDYPQWFWEAISTYEANEVNTLSVMYAMRSEPTLKALNDSNQIYNVAIR